MRATFPLTAGFASLVFVGVLIAARAGTSEKSPTFAGAWNLNVPMSTYRPGPAPKSAVLSVKYNKGTRHSLLETVTHDGEMVRTEYQAVEDGKDYPLTGSPNADTVSLRRPSPGTIERIDKRGGQVVMVLTLRLSQDGDTLTVTQKGVTGSGDTVSNVMIYDRQ
jgi:hypothetical protein